MVMEDKTEEYTLAAVSLCTLCGRDIETISYHLGGATYCQDCYVAGLRWAMKQAKAEADAEA